MPVRRKRRQSTAKRSSPTHRDIATGGSGPTVLVADDYDDTRFMMRQVLERRGYRVVEALTGTEAVRLARREHPDLILMDINLPLIDGVNATRRIREIEGMGGVPIVAVSAYDAADLREAALTAGCVEYLPKPVDADQLESLVNRWLPIKETTGKRRDKK